MVLYFRKVILPVACFILFLFLFFFVVRETIPTKVNDNLLIYYDISGILAGIFAFGAFVIALVSYWNQIKTNDLQRFETTFFNMLALQQQITNDLKYEGDEPLPAPDDTLPKNIKYKHVSKTGRELFEFFWLKLWYPITVIEGGKIILGRVSGKYGMCELLVQGGSKEYNSRLEITLFDHYFRHLYRIVKFVDDTCFLDDNQKYEYLGVLRATLSRYELVWLYYNCLYGAGKYKFKPLVEKYALLKNLRDNLLFVSRDVTDKYTPDRININIDDYIYYMTDKKTDNSKYYIGAFYNERNKKEFIQGVKYYKTKNK